MTEAMPSVPLPVLGEMLRYRLDKKAVLRINKDRQSGIGVRGNIIREGDTFAMMCTAHNIDGSINGQVFLDGNDHFWAVMVMHGYEPGQWSRRPLPLEARAAEEPAKVAAKGKGSLRPEAVRIDPGRDAA